MLIDQQVEAAEKDARSLLKLHDADPKLADEVARKFGYDDFADAKKYIDQKDFSDGGVEKTRDASIKEDFEKFAEGLEEVINYIKTQCLKDGGASEKFTDVNFEEL